MPERLRSSASALGVLCGLIGATTFLGWILDDPLLKGGYVSGITMKTNAAIGFMISGLALFLLAGGEARRVRLTLGRLAALLVAGLGGATLLQHITGWDLGIDQLLFREATGAVGTQSPNRMGPPASICFTLLGIAYLTMAARPRRALHQRLAIAVLLITSVPILGYLFHVRELYGIARYSGIALLTAVTLLLLALGSLCARPETGFMRRLLARDSGALLTRRLLPAAILLPIGLMLLRITGQDSGLYDLEFGRALLVLSFIVVFTVLIWQTGRVVSRQEQAAARSEALLQSRLVETLQALREADRRKDDFLATLAHELRNPLAPVRNAAHLLRLKGSSDPEIEWAQAVIDRQVDHLSRLIEDLVDVSRITRDRLELRRSRIALSEIIAVAVEGSQPEIGSQRHSLALNLPEEPLHVEGDLIRLTQVFMNLLTNAAKYTPPGGRIRLSAERDGDEAVVRVSDNGIGIAREHRLHVFEMFYRTEDVLERTRGGLGIGLALVHHLVRLHGGTVTAASDGPGLGSEFTVRLPLAPAGTAARIAAEADGRKPRLEGRRVLVVDDNEDAATSLGVLLQHAGAEVFTARDGQEALETAARARPEIVLLDIGLPKMNGYDVARRIRAHAGDGVVLIALTGWGQEEDRERSRAAGFDRHLIKPVGPDDLLRLIQEIDASRSVARG